MSWALPLCLLLSLLSSCTGLGFLDLINLVSQSPSPRTSTLGLSHLILSIASQDFILRGTHLVGPGYFSFKEGGLV